MPLESHRYAPGQDHGITLDDHAGAVPTDRAAADITLPGDSNAMYGGSAGCGDHLAAMSGGVAQSDHVLHV